MLEITNDTFNPMTFSLGKKKYTSIRPGETGSVDLPADDPQVAGRFAVQAISIKNAQSAKAAQKAATEANPHPVKVS